MRYFIAFALVFSTLGAASAVEPVTTDSFGNPEEPAVRPYKWAIQGIGALFFQTFKGLRDGNMNTPVLGSVEAGRGVGIGTIELGNQVWKGMLFAPMEDKEYKRTHEWNEVMEKDDLTREVRDFVFTAGVGYPRLKRNDWYPAESDEKVRVRLDNAEEIREKREQARKARNPQPNLDRREKAQIRYVGNRASYGLEKKQDTTGNLLKLAK